MSVVPVVPEATTNARRYARFIAAAGLLLFVYVIAVPLVYASDNVVGENGPLSRTRSAATKAPPGATASLSQVRKACSQLSGLSTADQIKIVSGTVDAHPYFACYGVNSTGSTSGAAVVDGDAMVVHDTALIKRTGAWRWIGTVKTPFELVLGGLGMVAIAAFTFLYYRRLRPGPTEGGGFWQSRWVDGLIGMFGPFGWLVLTFDKKRSRARKIRLIMMSVVAFSAFVCFVLFTEVSTYPDAVGYTVTGLLAAQMLCCLGMGRFQVAPLGFGQRVALTVEQVVPTAAAARTPPAAVYRQPASTPPAYGRAAAASAPPQQAPTVTQERPDDSPSAFKVKGPVGLPTFTEVGGMDLVKQELQDSVGLLLAFGDEAEAYKLAFNGILLYGPPGTGKTFFAEATAGELGLRYLRIAVTDLVSKFVGESAKNIERAFATAAANVPCVLFFDEFDSVAGRRDDDPNEENRRVVNQLLTSLEEFRSLRELVVMAATNDIEKLDTAVIRPGRFDRRIRIDLPDEAARSSILRAQLAGRPLASEVDLAAVVHRTEGLSAAAIAAVVGDAAMAAFRETTASGSHVSIGTPHLMGALATRGGKDRPTVENWSWDRLILDDGTKAELQQLQELIENPAAAQVYGIEAPAGLLLTGPPGTGKTTIARVLAAEAKCSFYPITAADLTSKWVGESEGNVSRLFARARENAPSIVFIDEIDAIAATRGGGSSSFGDKILNQLLAEMDGLRSGGRVFVVAATNRADVLDPALTRGGRLSRTMVVGLPRAAERKTLLTMFTEPMPLYRVILDDLVAKTDGLAGADLEALCQQAAVAAMTRSRSSRTVAAPRVTTADFESALATVEQARSARQKAASSNDMAAFLNSLSGPPSP